MFDVARTILHRPRALGFACAVAAVLLGLVYMAIAGAPTRYLIINAGALVIGCATLPLLDLAVAGGSRSLGGIVVAMAAALLATAILGPQVEGAARWVDLGGFVVQPSLVLLPVMLVAFARTRTTLATGGIVAAAAALALQPDRAMAAMLVVALVTLALLRRDRNVLIGLAAASIGLTVTLERADALPAVPYVDQILYSSFNVHLAAGLAVLTGTVLLVVPALSGWRRDPDCRVDYAVFGAVWFVAILAAALGNYPTPIVGYGGSAIIGYMMSLVALPRHAGSPAAETTASSRGSDPTTPGGHLRVGLG
ncbi:hypothetical protein SAMN06297144_0441 [Sphingomonas guangdongensis]|uniref:Peptidoglycan polymerase n=1 Tax=Sphingomonas guangdongensis TaxID=1141890 RepID=A0A285QCP9_9SPHN|nr:hypothetical protein [Sphingomonas guangdongensis]SOB79229.1 hypothetical protein SAMN06297144_0441 [Sphingomonas guangdongensis]